MTTAREIQVGDTIVASKITSPGKGRDPRDLRTVARIYECADGRLTFLFAGPDEMALEANSWYGRRTFRSNSKIERVAS